MDPPSCCALRWPSDRRRTHLRAARYGGQAIDDRPTFALRATVGKRWTMMRIYGINAVTEALRAGRVVSLRMGRRNDQRLAQLLRLAEHMRVPIRRVGDAELDRESGGSSHQGIIADVAPIPVCELDDLIRDAPSPALLVVVDGIEDPQNFGAIVRTVDAAGAHGIIRQTRHSAPLGGAASKASAGALAHVKIADVVNVARAIEELKEAGIWTVGLAGDAPRRYDELDLRLPLALVLGAEGAGLRRLVRERCDLLMAIPMRGHVDSLNVSVAAGVALFEAVRQRDSGLQAPGSRPGRPPARSPESGV